MENLLCEVRFAEDETRQSPGRMVGILATLHSLASDRNEMFMDGALYFPRDGKIVINEMHNRQAPILKATPELVGAELRINEPFPDTQRGRDAATLVQNGTLTGLSVEMYVERATRARNGIREIRRAYCPRAGLVDVPSYADSLVEVRARRVWQIGGEDLLRWL